MYADDVMFLGEWSLSNINNLRRLLRCFYLASGLKVNLAKCSVYGFGVGEQDVTRMANHLRCRQGTFPFIHLGLLVGANMNLARNWKSVIEVFKNRLSIWKAKTLSYGGRITLIKSVLNALPTYFFSLFKAPIKVLDALDKIRRVFFWVGSEEKAKMNWVAWEKTIAPVDYGGLGFGSIRDANLAMLAKWWWRFKTEKNSLWRKVVWAIHHNNRAWNDIPVKTSISGPWKNIISIRSNLIPAGIDLKKAICAKLANGENIHFWLDIWADPVPFYLKFPALFKNESRKDCSVKDRLLVDDSGPNFAWAWSRPIINSSEVSQLQELMDIASGQVMRVGSDQWFWMHDHNGYFSVANIKNLLSSVGREMPARRFEWNNWVPKKVAIVAWRAEMERLPTKCALRRRNIMVQNNLCVHCGYFEESCEHVFVICQFAQAIWQYIADWCRIPPVVAFDVRDLLDLHCGALNGRKKKKALHAVVLVTFWSLWKMRNEVVFSQASPCTTKILDEIKAMAFLWVKHRSRMVELTWEKWSRFEIIG